MRRGMNKIGIAAVSLMAFSAAAIADDVVQITAPQELHWQMNPAGRVFLRNLDQFDGTFLGCCYNYQLDVTTAEGKAMWSTLLAYIAMDRPFYVYVQDKSQPSQVTFIGY